ncbi:unnamed protein product [Effrenium voratum]|uniref:Uncharacterized protein n=1 Tax=Effrenium voratum TaxID=2562239 RepID=A0AA36I9W5_9DINO|nr:unnamed protein product [Effrenium voratum]
MCIDGQEDMKDDARPFGKKFHPYTGDVYKKVPVVSGPDGSALQFPLDPSVYYPPLEPPKPGVKWGDGRAPDGNWYMEVDDQQIQYWQGVGKRKTACAIVRIVKGNGQFIVNGRDAIQFFNNYPIWWLKACEPLSALSEKNSFDIIAKSFGGGVSGQAGAIRLALARAMQEYNFNWRPLLKKAKYLTRDWRMVEPKKTGHDENHFGVIPPRLNLDPAGNQRENRSAMGAAHPRSGSPGLLDRPEPADQLKGPRTGAVPGHALVGSSGSAQNAQTLCAKLLAISRAPLQLADVVLTIAALLSAVCAVCAVSKLVDLGWIDREVSTLSLSLACPLITIISYVAPSGMVLDAVRLLKANQLPVVVFKLQAACNVLSIAYGLQISNAAVLMTNMFGLACQVLFLAGDHYASVDSQWLFFALKISVLIDVGILCASSYVPMNILGQCITVCNVGLYSCPLMNMGNLLRTRNSSALPAFMVGINVLNNALWSLYALLIEDMVVLVPSLLGYCCSFFQIMLILWCRHLLPFDLSFLLTFFARKKPDASPELDHEEGLL